MLIICCYGPYFKGFRFLREPLRWLREQHDLDQNEQYSSVGQAISKVSLSFSHIFPAFPNSAVIQKFGSKNIQGKKKNPLVELFFFYWEFCLFLHNRYSQ